MSEKTEQDVTAKPANETDVQLMRPEIHGVALAPTSRGPSFAPTNLTEAIAFSKMVASSDLAPKDFKGKPGNVLIAIQMGYEIGLKPLQALQNIAIINGRPSLWGDAALAVVQNHPAYESHEESMEGAGETRCAVFTIKRKGNKPHTIRFGVADAKKAGLWGKAGPWTNYPDRMMRWRAAGFALRDKFADALRGLNIAEEAMDIPPDAPKRERAALDADALTTLSESAEPNRGHGNEGMQQTETATEQPETQRTRRGVLTVGRVDAKMRNPTPAAIKKAKDEKQPAPEAREYFVLVCSDAEGKKQEIGCWDKKHYPHILKAAGKECEFTIAANNKGDRMFYNLEHIHRIGDQTFENDVPVAQAEQGEFQPPTGS